MAAPVLLVHGIWNDSSNMERLRHHVETRLQKPAVSISLQPSDGRAPISSLALQVADAERSLRLQTGEAQVDLVGFSMGALVSRYFLQRLGGKQTVRRFVSISGPHHGTALALGLPHAGVRDMRPGSRLLRDLDRDDDPFGNVEVHVIYTPFDLVIVPARSGVLRNAHSVTRIPVLLHRWMIMDKRVLDVVHARLKG